MKSLLMMIAGLTACLSLPAQAEAPEAGLLPEPPGKAANETPIEKPATPGPEDTKPLIAPGDTDGVGSQRKSLDLGPYKFTAGIDEGNAFGASVHGSHAFPLSWLSEAQPKKLDRDAIYTKLYTDLLLDIDAGWSTKPDALNNASLSFKPALQWTLNRSFKSGPSSSTKISKPLAPLAGSPAENGGIILGGGSGRFEAAEEIFVLGSYGDFRYRYGNFKDGTGVSRINQFFAGGGTQLYLIKASQYALFREAPRVAVGYYTVMASSGLPAAIPDGLTADHVTVDATVKLRLPFPNVDLAHSHLELDASYRGSQATTGGNRGYENFVEATLFYRTQSGQRPAVTYRSGKEQGLSYDRQVIVGLLWELLP